MTRFHSGMVLGALILGGARGAAQGGGSDQEARRLAATRTELEQLAARVVQGSPNGAVARSRLADGDFQVGDAVLLAVMGEPQLSDTFVVGPRRSLLLPMAGEVRLNGVLYSEIEIYLGRQLGRWLREPVVQARALVRLSITGAVARPGFYLVPGDALLSEVVTAAGGLTSDAKLSDLRVERAGAPILKGRELRLAFEIGRTLDQANVRSGDQLVVPGRRGGMSAYEQVRLVGILLTIPVTIYTLTRLF